MQNQTQKQGFLLKKLSKLLCSAVLGILVACGTSSPGWNISLNPSNPALTLTQGNSATLQAVFKPTDGFSGDVALALEKQDGSAVTGVTLTPNTVNVGANPTNATLTIQTTASTVAGNYNLRVKASNSGESKTANFTLSVQNAATPALSVSLNPNSLNIIRGDGGSMTMTLTPQNSFSGNVNLILENQDGSPAPAGLAISPTTANVSSNPTNVTLTLTSTSSTPTGTQNLRVRVAGNGLSGCGSHCANLNVVVGTKVELDPTFDGDGIVITSVSAGYDYARDLILQPDGKLVVAGMTSTALETGNFSLVRYNSDGSLDTSFDIDGIVATDFNSAYDAASALALQTDGKIVVGGISGFPGSFLSYFSLARYNADGSLDTSFDIDGKVTSSLRGEAQDLIIQPDGKIVMTGKSPNGSDMDFALLRYNADGSIDTSFDTDGIVTTNFSSFNEAEALIIQPDGKIIVTGHSSNDFALARYNSDGSLDTTFDTDGKVTTSFGPGTEEAASNLILQADGKIMVLGTSRVSGSYDFALIRYNPDGSLDTSFGTEGKVTTSMTEGSDYGMDLLAQPDGKIIAGGFNSVGSSYIFSIARYNPDGSLDLSFDADGKMTGGFGSTSDLVYALVLQPDGKLVVAGQNDRAIALARYIF